LPRNTNVAVVRVKLPPSVPGRPGHQILRACRSRRTRGKLAFPHAARSLPLSTADDPRQSHCVHVMTDDHAAIVRQHDLYPTSCQKSRQYRRLFLATTVESGFCAGSNADGSQAMTAWAKTASLPSSASRRPSRAKRRHLNIGSPTEHDAAPSPIPSGGHPRSRQRSAASKQRPTPPGARRNHLKPRDLRLCLHAPTVPAKRTSPDAYETHISKDGRLRLTLLSEAQHNKDRPDQNGDDQSW
jgi:hypothetical protein